MAKKRNKTTEESNRQSRKEILIARKQAQQTRQIRLALAGVAALLGLVFLVAIVNEYVIAPTRAVATVNGQVIELRDWQERVRYERAQRIILLENQLEAFSGDVGIIQQFAGQMILELQDAEALAQNVLDQMVDEEVVRQLAVARGIEVSEADIDSEIGEAFNFFGGESPTPLPTATETVVPTPSITPIPSAVITDEVTAPLPTPTTGPTSTPRPTATPVSEEAFQEQFGELLGQLSDYDVDEDTYRTVVRSQLYREKLLEVLAEEGELPTEAEHASLFLIAFESEEQANRDLEMISDGDFLTVWNTIRTAPAELELGSSATELIWRTQEELASVMGDEAAKEVFDIPLDETSDLFVQQIDEDTSGYFIFQVSGREVRPLSDTAMEQKRLELLASIIDQQLAGNLESTEFWRSRVPTQPVLDPKFLAPPTPTPQQPAPEPGGDDVPVEPTPEDGS